MNSKSLYKILPDKNHYKENTGRKNKKLRIINTLKQQGKCEIAINNENKK